NSGRHGICGLEPAAATTGAGAGVRGERIQPSEAAERAGSEYRHGRAVHGVSGSGGVGGSDWGCHWVHGAMGGDWADSPDVGSNIQEDHRVEDGLLGREAHGLAL